MGVRNLQLWRGSPPHLAGLVKCAVVLLPVQPERLGERHDELIALTHGEHVARRVNQEGRLVRLASALKPRNCGAHAAMRQSWGAPRGRTRDASAADRRRHNHNKPTTTRPPDTHLMNAARGTFLKLGLLALVLRIYRSHDIILLEQEPTTLSALRHACKQLLKHDHVCVVMKTWLDDPIRSGSRRYSQQAASLRAVVLRSRGTVVVGVVLLLAQGIAGTLVPDVAPTLSFHSSDWMSELSSGDWALGGAATAVDNVIRLTADGQQVWTLIYVENTCNSAL